MGTDDMMPVEIETVGDVCVLMPQADIDLSGSPLLRERLREAMDAKPKPARMVIDLGAVMYMDSSGVATLVEAMQHARRDKIGLVLCGLGEQVQAIFEIARLDTVFEIVADRQAAMVSVA